MLLMVYRRTIRITNQNSFGTILLVCCKNHSYMLGCLPAASLAWAKFDFHNSLRKGSSLRVIYHQSWKAKVTTSDKKCLPMQSRQRTFTNEVSTAQKILHLPISQATTPCSDTVKNHNNALTMYLNIFSPSFAMYKMSLEGCRIYLHYIWSLFLGCPIQCLVLSRCSVCGGFGGRNSGKVAGNGLF